MLVGILIFSAFSLVIFILLGAIPFGRALVLGKAAPWWSLAYLQMSWLMAATISWWDPWEASLIIAIAPIDVIRIAEVALRNVPYLALLCIAIWSVPSLILLFVLRTLVGIWRTLVGSLVCVIIPPLLSWSAGLFLFDNAFAKHLALEGRALEAKCLWVNSAANIAPDGMRGHYSDYHALIQMPDESWQGWSFEQNAFYQLGPSAKTRVSPENYAQDCIALYYAP